MSILDDAFHHVLDARERVVGVREKVKIRGTDFDALVETISTAEVAVAGGVAESGGFRCQVAVSDIDPAPAQGDAIEIRGKQLSILEFEDVNGIVFMLVAGDPANE